jgi:hypothetical protein
MAYIRGEAREQVTMFPVTLDELIPEDHLPVEAVSVWLLAAGAVVAAAGSRVPAQCGRDVAAGTFAAGLQVDRRVPAHA